LGAPYAPLLSAGGAVTGVVLVAPWPDGAFAAPVVAVVEGVEGPVAVEPGATVFEPDPPQPSTRVAEPTNRSDVAERLMHLTITMPTRGPRRRQDAGDGLHSPRACAGIRAWLDGMSVATLRRIRGIQLRGSSPLLALKSDEQLARLVRDGHDAAFDVLVGRYASRLAAFCRHLLPTSEDAEDVLQEVLVAV